MAARGKLSMPPSPIGVLGRSRCTTPRVPWTKEENEVILEIIGRECLWEEINLAERLRTGTFHSKNACPQGSEYEYSATDLY
jgi:hypothetical protein